MKTKIQIKGKKIIIFLKGRQIIRWFDNIRLCESCKHHVDIHFFDGEVITVMYKISDLAAMLPTIAFCLCHKRFIVHFKLVMRANIVNHKISYNKPVAPPPLNKKSLLTEGFVENPKIRYKRIIIPIARLRRAEFYRRAAEYDPLA